MAAGLVEKAGKLSVSHWIGAAGVHKRARALRRRATELVEDDAQAYLAFVEASRASKGPHSELRRRVVGPELARTVEVPLAVVRSAAETVALAADLVVHGNPKLRSDAIVAAHLAAAAAQAGAVTIASSLAAASRDARLAEARRLARAARVRVRSL